MRTIVLITRHADITHYVRTRWANYPTESIGGRYQHVWSLAQREAWLRGRAERLAIVTSPEERWMYAGGEQL
jgi:hypothetical protein